MDVLAALEEDGVEPGQGEEELLVLAALSENKSLWRSNEPKQVYL